MSPEERYQLTTRLAQRHKSELWIALDQQTGEEVLFKVFREWTDDFLSFRRALHAEAKMVQRMKHPQLPAVIDVGTWRGRDFLATEIVKGETLYSLFQRLRKEETLLPLSLVVKWVTQIGSLLEYVHRFPHPDSQVPLRWKHHRLMTDQLIVTPSLDIKVLGFGTPRKFRHLDNQSPYQSRRPWRYLPAEVLRGALTEEDSDNDLWVLGLLLYELATTCKAFRFDRTENASSMMEIKNVAYGKLRNPSELRDSFPLTLQRLIGFAMHPDPSLRFSSLSDFLDGLSLFLALERLQAERVSPGEWLQHARECLHDNNLAALLGLLRLGGEEEHGMFQEYLWMHLRPLLEDPLKDGHPLAWPHSKLLEFLPVARDCCAAMMRSPEIPEATQLELLKSLQRWPERDSFVAMCGALQGHSAKVARLAHQRMESHSSPPPLAWSEETRLLFPCPHSWEGMSQLDDEPFNRIRFCKSCGAPATKVQDVKAFQRLAGEHCASFSPDVDPNEQRILVSCNQQSWWLSTGERLRLGGDPAGDLFNPEMEGESLWLVNQGNRRLALQFDDAEPDWLPPLQDAWTVEHNLLKIRYRSDSNRVLIEDLDRATLQLEIGRYATQITHYFSSIEVESVSFCEVGLPQQDRSLNANIPALLVVRDTPEASSFVAEGDLTPALLEKTREAQEVMFCSVERWNLSNSEHSLPTTDEVQNSLDSQTEGEAGTQRTDLWARVRRFFGKS